MKNLLLLFLPFSLLSQNENIKDLHSQFLKDSLAYISFEKEHGKYIQTKNVNMHYLEWGNPKNPTLVWIHGTYSNGTEIIELVDSLVNSGIHIIAIDYYGHGKTEIPKKEVSLYDVADDIKFLLDSKKIKSTYIAGWSRGGSIATAFYDNYASMVNGIVLIDGGAANWIRKRQNLNEEIIKAHFEKLIINQTYYHSPYELYCANYTSDYPIWNIYNFSFFGTEEKGWTFNPNLQVWLQDNTVELKKQQFYKPATCNLFNQSTFFMLPEVIYRNLKTKILIIDPLKDDSEGFFSFSDEYLKIQNINPSLVKISKYNDATHAVIFEETIRLQNEIINFIKNQ